MNPCFHFHQIELIEDSKYTEPPATQASSNFEALINNREWADYAFACCDDKKIYVQKAIVAVQCPALADVIRARSLITELPDIDSETMTELLRFIYCRKVNDIEKIAIKLLTAAHKYKVEDLKQMCVLSLMGSITIQNVNGILETADRLKEENLKDNCIDFIKW